MNLLANDAVTGPSGTGMSRGTDIFLENNNRQVLMGSNDSF